MIRFVATLVLAAGALQVRAEGTATADQTSVTIALPAEHSPGCFADSMRFPRELVARLPERADVIFTVEETGAIRDVLVDGSGSGALATQVRGGLSRCAWTPAADTTGVPMTMVVELPIRFERPPGLPAIAAAVRVELGELALAAR